VSKFFPDSAFKVGNRPFPSNNPANTWKTFEDFVDRLPEEARFRAMPKDDVTGFLAYYKATGEAAPEMADPRNAIALLEGFFDIITEDTRYAMLGLFQHLIYCPLASLGHITKCEGGDFVYDHGGIVKAATGSFITHQIAQTYTKEYLHRFWGANVSRPTLRKMLQILAAAGCFSLESYTPQTYLEKFGGIFKKVPTVFHNMNLMAITWLAGDWQRLMNKAGFKLDRDTPAHRGFIVPVIHEMLITIHNLDGTPRTPLIGRTGEGTKFQTEKRTEASQVDLPSVSVRFVKIAEELAAKFVAKISTEWNGFATTPFSWDMKEDCRERKSWFARRRRATIKEFGTMIHGLEFSSFNKEPEMVIDCPF
jgi:hypothetical protein